MDYEGSLWEGGRKGGSVLATQSYKRGRKRGEGTERDLLLPFLSSMLHASLASPGAEMSYMGKASRPNSKKSR